MAKKSKSQIAFDPITKQALPAEELPFTWVRDPSTHETVKSYDPMYEGLEVEWRPNLSFFARFRLTGLSSTYSGSATADVENVDTGEQLDMYASEFNQVIDRIKDGGILEGNWIFRRKGGRYTLEGV